MELYTYNEILADASRHEGVKIEHNVDHHGVMYLRLYSRTFPRLSDEMTVNDVLKRVREFMNDQSYMIPQTDIAPTEFGDTYKFLVYRFIGNEPVLAKISLEFIAGHNDPDELVTYLKPESNETGLCIVFVEEQEVSYHHRNFN